MATRREAEVCDELVAAAEAQGWVAYPEVDGWDVVLVRDLDGPDPLSQGDQLAVEVKARSSVTALQQAISRSTHQKRGQPDFRGVYAPNMGADFRFVARALRVIPIDLSCIITPESMRWERPAGRLWLPPIVPKMKAGQPSPSPLSRWRVAALRLVARGRERGYLTREDFKEAAVSPRLWTQMGWCKRQGALYLLDEATRGFPAQGWEAELQALTSCENKPVGE